jgi:hypothetical protein
MECYALNDRVLAQFCQMYLGVAFARARFAELFQIAAELFLFRAAKISLGTTPWVNTYDRLCSIQAGRITFDKERFIQRLLNASGGRLARQIFEDRIVELRSRLSADFRQQVNGHDVLRLLSWYAHQLGVENAIYNGSPLQRGLFASLEMADLQCAAVFTSRSAWAM